MDKKIVNRIFIFLCVIHVFFGLVHYLSLSFLSGIVLNIFFLGWFIIRSDYKFYSPLFIGAILFYVTFIFPMLIVALLNGIKASGLISFTFNIEPSLFSKTVWIINIAMAAYFVGVKIGSYFFRSKQEVKFQIKKVFKIEYFLAILWFTFSGYIRYRYSLGAAGRNATIGNVGILQHLFYTGNLVLFSYYFLFSIDNKNKSHFIYVIVLGLIIIATQIYLGWRGTAFSLAILCFLLYKTFNNPNKLIFSKTIVVLGIAILPIATTLGNYSRSLSLTNSKIEYASGPSQFVQNVFFRQQGLSRLLVVMNNSDKDFLTNDFFITELFRKNISATNYIDWNYFGLKRGVKNSFGGSGIGCAYVMGGAVFTFYIFLFVGISIASCYNLMQSNSSVIYVVIYANLILLFRTILAENFGLYIIKVLFVVGMFSYFYSYLFKLKIK